MTRTNAFHVRIPDSEMARYKQILKKAGHLYSLIEDESLCDEMDLRRYSQAMDQIEEMAYRVLRRDGEDCLAEASGDGIVDIAWPFSMGANKDEETTNAGAERKSVSAWRASDPKANPTEATRERFEESFRAWSDPDWDTSIEKPPICPNGIKNKALTETLRKYAQIQIGNIKEEARVVYLDGSEARPFPVCQVEFLDDIPDGLQIYRFALISTRHMEMDAILDGAWLRNREISVPRPSAETDELAFRQSLEQFETLAEDGPILIYLYQTGFEPAIMGFYRALIHFHLIKKPVHNVAVVPMYFSGDDKFSEGLAWNLK